MDREQLTEKIYDTLTKEREWHETADERERTAALVNEIYKGRRDAVLLLAAIGREYAEPQAGLSHPIQIGDEFLEGSSGATLFFACITSPRIRSPYLNGRSDNPRKPQLIKVNYYAHNLPELDPEEVATLSKTKLVFEDDTKLDVYEIARETFNPTSVGSLHIGFQDADKHSLSQMDAARKTMKNEERKPTHTLELILQGIRNYHPTLHQKLGLDTFDGKEKALNFYSGIRR